MSEDRLRVEGFGPLRVYVDDDEIDLGPPKQRAAFAVLALCAGTTVSRGELVDGIWGEAPPTTAAGSLHTYLSGLRRALGPLQNLLVSERAGYSLRLPRESFDILAGEDLVERARMARGTGQALEAYQQALARWSPGSYLVGVPGPFVAQARDRLAGVRLRLLVDYAELAQPTRLPEVIDRLLAEIPAHPFDERLRSVLMTALHRVGRTADALAQYENLRRGLAAELGISPAPATQAVYAEILADDRRAGADPPPKPASEGALRPAQLPHDNDVFVGRSAELLAVLGSSAGRAEPRRRIVMIVGVGGIGKTALAVRSGHMLRDGYPDGQVYINLRGFDPSHAALTPDAALHQLLTSVGARQVPSGHEERIALWRSMLADKRVLLVLDNASTAEQVEDLLPGGDTCFVIVTSRNRLSGLAVRHGARRIPLGPLSPDESMGLLAAMVGEDRVKAEPEPARRLTTLCDRSPFALQIAAEQVGSTSDARIGDLVGQLENVQHRLDALQLADDPLCSVRGVLSWSFAALTDDEARAFRLLGVFPGPTVTRHTAAALLGVDLDGAENLLGKLSACYLLEQEDDRFTMHDLTKVYATELSGGLGADDRRDALSRVLSWYRVTLTNRRGDGLAARGAPIEPPHSDVPPVLFDQQRDCLRWCEVEWQNIVALVRAANRDRQHGPAWHLTCLLFDYFYTAGQPLEWLALLRVAMRSAEATGNHRAQAMLLNHSSVAYSRLGQNDTAVQQLNRGLELLLNPDDWRDRISLLGNLASTLREAKRYDAAREPAREALELARKEGIDYYLAAMHDILCELNAETGRWDEAMRDGLPGLAYARRARSQILEANLLINLGLARHGLGQQEAAEETFADALRISEDAGDRYHEALALFGLARASASDGGGGKGSVDLARRALVRFDELHAEEAAEVRAFLAGLEI
ncbi:BTAD domain-containing putative transcriptional regulator [Solwaraspora sp. WMMD1047]|uniref:AfsR/SARP family transcriptional regulator n=1 Tax=Solwaraspora sp. WMMD1047 TaxID=3016102 RepID=UPI0024167BBF|nr:BTAD domain-containing putative transcriptional regulator [Solwaraspora sp. WMMD1047]MDG4834712.1 BTAD domain-containing putative transcriptional regulator [Solwaraspora sp. WMMD1047]